MTHISRMLRQSRLRGKYKVKWNYKNYRGYYYEGIRNQSRKRFTRRSDFNIIWDYDVSLGIEIYGIYIKFIRIYILNWYLIETTNVSKIHLKKVLQVLKIVVYNDFTSILLPIHIGSRSRVVSAPIIKSISLLGKLPWCKL